LFEDFINALRNFKSNKTRTLLSLLGIIIGVASVIMVTTIGQSATENVKRSLGQAGLDLVQLHPGWAARRSQEIELNENFRNELASSIRGIKNIIFNNEFGGHLRYGSLDLGISIQAVEQDYFAMLGLALDYGRFFSVTEHVLGSQKIILGSEGARYLFPEGNALGKTVILQMDGFIMGFEVIGILAESDAIGFQSPNQSAFVPGQSIPGRSAPAISMPAASLSRPSARTILPGSRRISRPWPWKRQGTTKPLWCSPCSPCLTSTTRLQVP
jgi:putative ABC transport system permease protein